MNLQYDDFVPDPSILERSKKYILTGHGSLIKGEYTIVPENVYIQYDVSRGSSFKIASIYRDTYLFNNYYFLRHETVESNFSSFLKIYEFYKIFKSNNNKYLIINYQNGKKMYYTIENNTWILISPEQDEEEFYLEKFIYINEIYDNKIKYSYKKNNLNLNTFKAEFINFDPKKKIYIPGSVIQNQNIDFEVDFPESENYKDTWFYSGLYSYTNLLNKSKNDKEEKIKLFKRSQKSIINEFRDADLNKQYNLVEDFLDSVKKKDENIILQNNYIQENNFQKWVQNVLSNYLILDELINDFNSNEIYIPETVNSFKNSKDNFLSLHEDNLFKIEKQRTTLSEIFKQLNKRTNKEEPIFLFMVSCRICNNSNIKEMIIASCDTDQIQEQQIEEADFIPKRTFSSDMDNVSRNLSSKFTTSQYQDLFDNQKYLDLNELFNFDNEWNDIINYMNKYKLFNLKLTKKAQNIELYGREYYKDNILLKDNLPQVDQIVILTNFNKPMYNGKEATVLSVNKWKKSKNIDTIAVRVNMHNKSKTLHVPLKNLKIEPGQFLVNEYKNMRQQLDQLNKDNIKYINIELELKEVYNYFIYIFLKEISKEIKNSYLINRKDYCSIHDLIIKKKINSKLIDKFYIYISKLNNYYLVNEFLPFLKYIEELNQQGRGIYHYEQEGGFDF